MEYGYCQVAKAAIEGINNVTHNEGGNVWYQFVAPTDDLLTVSSLNLTEEDTNVELFSGCTNGVEHTSIYPCDDYYGSKQSHIDWECQGGLTYNICWRGDKGASQYD